MYFCHFKLEEKSTLIALQNFFTFTSRFVILKQIRISTKLMQFYNITNELLHERTNRHCLFTLKQQDESAITDYMLEVLLDWLGFILWPNVCHWLIVFSDWSFTWLKPLSDVLHTTNNRYHTSSFHALHPLWLHKVRACAFQITPTRTSRTLMLGSVDVTDTNLSRLGFLPQKAHIYIKWL